MRRRTVNLVGKRTSMKLEPEFWRYLDQVAAEHSITVQGLLRSQVKDVSGNMASAVRVFCLTHATGETRL